MLGLDFHLISIFFYIAHFTKFKRGSSLFMEKSLLVEKSKAEETPWENIRKKKKQALRRKKGCHSVKKRKKNPFVEVTGTGGAHAGVQISNKEVAVKPKFAIHGGHYCVVLLNPLPSDRD